MVLRLKTRESRSLPGLPSARSSHIRIKRSGWRLIFSLRLYDACRCPKTARHFWATCIRPAKRDPGPRERPFRLVALESGKRKLTSMVDAGWSSPVARQAHNLKVTGSNPVPATKYKNGPPRAGRFCFSPCGFFPTRHGRALQRWSLGAPRHRSAVALT